MRRAGLADHARRRRPPGAGRRRAGGRPRRLLATRSRRRSRRIRSSTIAREEIAGPAARRVGRGRSSPPAPSPRRRSPRRSARSPARTRSPSSTPSRRSSTARRSTWTSPGSSRATTRAGPAAPGADYINCPMDREQYEAFVDALLAGDKTEFKEWEATRPISTAACRSR